MPKTAPTSWIVKRGSAAYVRIVKKWNCKQFEFPLLPNGKLVHAHVVENYAALDPYGPEQRVEFLGVMVTVWHPDSLTSSAHEQAPLKARRPDMGITETDISLAASKALERVMKQCTHLGAVYVRHTGRCLKEFRCPKCNARFEVDSGD